VEALEKSAAVVDRGRPRVARLRSSVDRLTRRVEQVLDAAMAGPHGAPLDREPLDLAELARAVVTRVEQERGRHAAPVRVAAPDPVRGRWDRLRVEGIVGNLIAVAAKRGGNEVEVRVTPETGGGRIEVWRSGAGDEAAVPYGQAAAAHEELEVGIWIARRFAEAHGGQLRVVRLPHLGARFTVDLPG
jgi:signal transduction histidine kinase